MRCSLSLHLCYTARAFHKLRVGVDWNRPAGRIQDVTPTEPRPHEHTHLHTGAPFVAVTTKMFTLDFGSCCTMAATTPKT